jgi:hypothetical protein
MWDHERLTALWALWAFRACYMDSFTFFNLLFDIPLTVDICTEGDVFIYWHSLYTSTFTSKNFLFTVQILRPKSYNRDTSNKISICWNVCAWFSQGNKKYIWTEHWYTLVYFVLISLLFNAQELQTNLNLRNHCYTEQIRLKILLCKISYFRFCIRKSCITDNMQQG